MSCRVDTPRKNFTNSMRKGLKQKIGIIRHMKGHHSSIQN